jgi:hypothetical protein
MQIVLHKTPWSKLISSFFYTRYDFSKSATEQGGENITPAMSHKKRMKTLNGSRFLSAIIIYQQIIYVTFAWCRKTFVLDR